MSGTAMDGIDVALIETDGYGHVKQLVFQSKMHDTDLRGQLKSCMNQTTYDPMIEDQFTMAHLPIINEVINHAGLSYNDIDVIGFHGQTTHHDPDIGLTVQMGNGDLLAQETNIDVVYRLRHDDMKNGGQGAPLIPVYHQALSQQTDLDFPIVVLNLGGVGNITWLSHDTMIAFDTGPANALIDDWVLRHTGQPYDNHGNIASSGTICHKTLDAFLSHPYFDKPYPKSLDRNDFPTIDHNAMSLADGTATLSAMTTHSVAKGIELCPQKPNAIYVTGGGRHNGFMMKEIERLTSVPTYSVDQLGWNGDTMEAEGFAYMAVRQLINEPISFPTTTGCKSPTVGGTLVRAKRQAA